MIENTENLDYSKLSEYFKEVESPNEMIPELEEMRTEYLELSLYAEQNVDNTNGTERHSHEYALRHSRLLGDLIRLLKTIQQPETTEQQPETT